MAQPADTTAATDLAALEALADSVESGAGLPDVVRAAARALDASLVVLDRAGNVLAVAARSPNEEQAILAGRAFEQLRAVCPVRRLGEGVRRAAPGGGADRRAPRPAARRGGRGACTD